LPTRNVKPKTKDELESDIHDAIWDSIYAEGGEVGGGDKAVERCVDIAVEYAKNKAVQFFKFNAKHIAEYMKYLRTSDLALGTSTYEQDMSYYEGATLENRYDAFIIEQLNTK